jgi:hypothetical protein
LPDNDFFDDDDDGDDDNTGSAKTSPLLTSINASNTDANTDSRASLLKFLKVESK